ncbi:SDR family oxidoreductase [Herbiconiux sp. CPCC 203407]|uniref:SDR family oxidoreductase n=1 Tax=Herbiconiux oxytropis TaxID=2970915 RepID=A0AA41XDL2_9MICO|nr:SDR family NAD(P)-dependent oxidoreductase [Herbiconiux oxytropis]MCS5721451.1 SDR family oxidoreductase [Herbiconiux oxytropis]MCS5724528.1 SDR family oxidoreductase [Herbiconiux oxytropis]
MVYRLENTIALVTGAAQGQGAAHVERLARDGARVIATDVLDEQGGALAERLNAEGLRVVYRHVDVASAKDWAEVVAGVDAEWGAITVLVNNAGIGSHAAVADVSREDWDRVVAINQTGILLGMQAVIPGMTAQGAGSIINIASSWAHRGGAESGHIAYVATKSAVLGITRNAAMNLGRIGIRVNSISPGYVRTAQVEFSEKNDPERVANDVAKIPMRRMARPAEIAKTVAFLASDESSYITGVDLLVDGGLNLA